jgi:hypothetical protein
MSVTWIRSRCSRGVSARSRAATAAMQRCRGAPPTASWLARGRGRRGARRRGVLRHPSTAWSLARGDDVLDGARAAGAMLLRHERRTAVLSIAAARPPRALVGMGGRHGGRAAASCRAGVGSRRRVGDRRSRSVGDRTAHPGDPDASAGPAVGRSRGVWPRCQARPADAEVGRRSPRGAPNATDLSVRASTRATDRPGGLRWALLRTASAVRDASGRDVVGARARRPIRSGCCSASVGREVGPSVGTVNTMR